MIKKITWYKMPSRFAPSFFYCYLAVSSLSKHGQIEFVLHFIEGDLLMITISKTGERDKFINIEDSKYPFS